MDDLTGKQFGSYRIIAPFGEGGMATVYKAYQASMDRYVALKVLPRYHSSDPEFLGRFEQEAKSLAQLQHLHLWTGYIRSYHRLEALWTLPTRAGLFIGM
jgi:serine/threonine protein kinase